MELTRGGNELPSRVADNLYWLGRYADRAEGLTRLLRGILVRLTERSGLAEAPELPALLRALPHWSESDPGFAEELAQGRLPIPDEELLRTIHDPHRPDSLVSVLNSLARVAGHVRDRISTDMWRVLRDLNQQLSVASRPLPVVRKRLTTDNWQLATDDLWDGARRTLSDELEVLDRTVLTLAAFSGLAMESVTRGQGWRFLDMGRKLERSLQILGLVRATLVPSSSGGIPRVVHGEGSLLEALLEIADSSMTYRRRYQVNLQAGAVLDLLLADETNPRSLAFQLSALMDDVEHLPREDTHPGRSAEQRLMLSSLTALRLADIEDLAQVDGQGRRTALDRLLAQFQTALPALSDAITQKYLSHLQASRHLGRVRWEE